MRRTSCSATAPMALQMRCEVLEIRHKMLAQLLKVLPKTLQRLRRLSNHCSNCGPELAIGKVIGLCHSCHRSPEFLEFLRAIDRSVPKDQKIHLVLAINGSIQKAGIVMGKPSSENCFKGVWSRDIARLLPCFRCLFPAHKPARCYPIPSFEAVQVDAARPTWRV